MLLTVPSFPATQAGTLTVQTTSLLGNLLYENTRTTRFRKESLGRAAAGWHYDVTLTDFQQTEPHGMAQLDADALALRRQLRLETDATGQLLRVTNKEQLRTHWAALRPQLLRKYQHSADITPGMIAGLGQVLDEEGHLEDVLRQGVEYGTLFPALYGQLYNETPTPGPARVIARFLANADLPMTTLVQRKLAVPADVAYGITVEGKLNGAEYPAEAVRHALRTMTDQQALDTTLRLEHRESYEFDEQHELRHAARFTVYGVPGIFMTKTICTLTAHPA